MLRLVLDAPHLSTEQIADRLGLDRQRVTIALKGLGFGITAVDLHPCGDPATHDRLLTALRSAHPEGAEDMEEGPAMRWTPLADGWRSLTGCSAATAADAA